MIAIIEITIKSGKNNLTYALIICQRNICYKNNKKYNITTEYQEDIIRTIRAWKNEYGNSRNIDDEEFTIIVKAKEKEEKFHGKGIFPTNYKHLKELLGDIHD